MRTGLALALLLSSSTAFAADPPPKPGSLTLCTQIVDLKYAQVGGSSVLGAKVGGVHVVNDGFCWQEYGKGRIHTGTLTSSVTVVITGSVLSQFRVLGYEAGFGQAFAPVNEPNGVVRHPYKQGFIIVHPSFGTRGIKNPLSALWNDNNTLARFGYPTSDQLPTPNGGYNRLERGYVARTNEMGSWIDFTGGGEGRTLAEVKLYSDWYLAPANPLTKVLAGESPVTLRPQLGSFDNVTSSLTFKAPTRTSLYLFDESPLEGRYTRITGADQSRIQLQALGTWMNDKPSSMVLVNHGSVSMSKTRAPLAAMFETAIDGVNSQLLLQPLFTMHDPQGSLTWNDDTTVTFLPGERLLQVTRSALVELEGSCVYDIVDCESADGEVEFSFTLRPELALMPHPLYPNNLIQTVRLKLVDAIAFSLGCEGPSCDDRNDALDVLFDDPTVVAPFATAFAKPFDSDFRTVADQVLCAGLGARRVNVLPEKLELVMGDTAYHASCATSSQLGSWFDGTRIPAVITNHNADGSPAIQFNGIYNVVPDFTLIVPPAVFN